MPSRNENWIYEVNLLLFPVTFFRVFVTLNASALGNRFVFFLGYFVAGNKIPVIENLGATEVLILFCLLATWSFEFRFLFVCRLKNLWMRLYDFKSACWVSAFEYFEKIIERNSGELE